VQIPAIPNAQHEDIFTPPISGYDPYDLPGPQNPVREDAQDGVAPALGTL
jgi:hypothetical protein